MSIERALTLYPRNAVTVDTGASVDVRNLDDVQGGTADATQTCTATHTQDNALRTFDPATAAGATVADAWTLQRKGWALPTADLTPTDDTNCNAILKAGTATVTFDATLSTVLGTGDTTNSQDTFFQASLWAYDPTTDVGVRIAVGGASGVTWNPQPIGGDNGVTKTITIGLEWGGSRTVTNKALASNVATLTTSAAHRFQVGMVVTVAIGDPVFDGTHTITAVGAGGSPTTFSYAKVNADVASAAASGTAVVTIVEFAQGSTLLLQLGLNTGVIANPISGTTTRTYALKVDTANTKIVWAAATVGQICRHTYSGGLTLDATRSDTVRRFRTYTGALDLAAAFDQRLTLFRSFTTALDLAAAYSRTLTASRAFTAAVDLNAARVTRAVRRAFVVGLDLSATKANNVKRGFTAALDLGATYSRVVTGFRSFAANVDLGAAYARVLTKRPSFTGGLSLGALLRICMSQEVLNRITSGGSTIVRKIMYLFDD